MEFEKRLERIKERKSRILSDWERDIEWMIEQLEAARSQIAADAKPLPDALFSKRFVVVTEHDHHDWLQSHGPIVLETYLRGSDLLGALDRADQLTRYGRAMICQLVPIGSPSEVQARAEATK